MLTLCPTIDYEIYLGRNNLHPEEVLFEPTRRLLNVWAEFDAKVTLFPDICSVWRHRELGIPDYADGFETQLREAAAAGHDVQLHLHPEWRSARLVDGAWRFEDGPRSLHDLGFSPADPTGAPQLIREGIRYLEELLRGVDPAYRCVAFRAGGWIVQPERDLVGALLSAGIRVDASIIPGAMLERIDRTIDFRSVPDRTMWFINPEMGIGVDTGRPEDLLEISIASYRGRFRAWQHVVNQMRLAKRSRRAPEKMRGVPGTKTGPSVGAARRLKNKYRKLTIPRVLDMADTHESMLMTMRSYFRRYDCAKEDIAVCFNGHSKDTYDYHLVELRRFLDIARRRYEGLVRFDSIARYLGRTPERRAFPSEP